MKEELQRRSALTDATLKIFLSRPTQWIHWRRFMQIAPCSWRTRVSDARRRVEPGGTIQWNRSIKRSAYRYLPYKPLGRDAGEQVSQRSLF